MKNVAIIIAGGEWNSLGRGLANQDWVKDMMKGTHS